VSGAYAAAPATALARVAALLREHGGLVGAVVVDGQAAQAGPGGPAQIAASGPRAAASPHEYELLVEAIYEGYLLHYGEPRIVRTADADLGLLAGDQLYALGLARLVALGDLVAVGELADVIALSALAQGAADATLAEAVWRAGSRAIGWGPSQAHDRAKALALAGAPGAVDALRAAAGA
jgi:hypothetical protein